MYDIESLATIIILSVLILIYLYLLLSPNQPHLPKKPFNVVIQRDTKENFDKFLKNMKGGYESYDWMKDAKFDDPYEVYNRSEKHKEDDFFLIYLNKIYMVIQRAKKIDLKMIKKVRKTISLLFRQLSMYVNLMHG
jgi:hypothetical protein